jgi:hypothetical protein
MSTMMEPFLLLIQKISAGGNGQVNLADQLDDPSTQRQ